MNTTTEPRARVERITGSLVQVSFAGTMVRRYFYLKREFGGWTLSRARGMDLPPRTSDGFRTQKDAIAEARRWLAAELAAE
jgi:hypothetical protein